MSEHLKLGELITTEQQRDCVHIAVCPVVARDELRAGTNVSLDESGRAIDSAVNAIGVVDPFLKAIVQPGQRFWLFLYPGSITSLRHDWTHPALPSEAPAALDMSEKAVSERWLRAKCEAAKASYWALIDGAQEGDYVSMGSNERESSALNSVLLKEGEADEVWHHIEVVLGRKFDAKHREATYFSCAC